jgi:hypothetical protein
MAGIERKSPVCFSARPTKTETRNGWTVVLEYAGEDDGPWLIDLSHCPKWDLQDSKISDLKPFGMAVPEAPGRCRLENAILINRMNWSQVSVWCFSKDPGLPEIPAFTETTDGQALLGLVGRNIFSITEKLSSLNLIDPKLGPPFLTQGPFCHVPCQIVVLERSGMSGACLVAFSRGYADDMIHAVLGAGREFGLRPAGENAFQEAMRKWTPPSGKSGKRGRQ